MQLSFLFYFLVLTFLIGSASKNTLMGQLTVSRICDYPATLLFKVSCHNTCHAACPFYVTDDNGGLSPSVTPELIDRPPPADEACLQLCGRFV